MIIFSQNKVNVGIWENFDVGQIAKENLLLNTKENYDGKDSDNNGYKDDVIGIGFDEFENKKEEKFISTATNYDSYSHGTMVANLLLSKNSNVALCGVGFEYTSDRLKKSGLSAMSSESRIAQLPSELDKMHDFVEASVDYFAKRKVKIVNLSWGLDLNRIMELNPNFGDSYISRKENATKWLLTFQKHLTDAFQKHPEILFVVAAGNEGVDSMAAFDVPGTIDLINVVVVGALDKQEMVISGFSNFGENITVYAPGESVKTKDIDGKEVEEDGTSLAAPFVSAYIADLLEKNINTNQIKQKLLEIKYLRTKDYKN